MRWFLFALVVMCACGPHFVRAHQPRFVQVDQHGETTIHDPELSQAFYGTLTDFPHLFTLTSATNLNLFVELLEPDIPSARHTISAIILRVHDHGVEEIARIPAEKVTWDSFYEPFGGDRYHRGPSFETVLTPGTYKIEVSTPENRDKYILVVGKREKFSLLSYIQTVRDIAGIKQFFGKPLWKVVQSPFVYMPLGVVCMCGFFLRRPFQREVVHKFRNI